MTRVGILLDVWESHIDQIQEGGVYSFSPVQVRIWSRQKKISTVIRTAITPIENPTLASLSSDVPDTASGGGNTCSITVTNISSVEKFESFSLCLNCSRRLLQATSTPIVRCERCRHTMRLKDCATSVCAKFVVKTDDGKRIYLTALQDALEKAFGEGMTADANMMTEKLLLLENLHIKYDSDSFVVSEIKTV